MDAVGRDLELGGERSVREAPWAWPDLHERASAQCLDLPGAGVLVEAERVPNGVAAGFDAVVQLADEFGKEAPGV